MKKLLLSFAMAAGLLVNASAQTGTPEYVPFPESWTIWTVHGYAKEMPKVDIYGLKNSDVVIDGKTYHELYKDNNIGLLTATAIGGLREADKRVYYYDYAAKYERILYDFNLEAGDVFDFGGMCPPSKVISVETVTIAGKERRKINFEQSWASWIEGIGNTQNGGMLNPAPSLATCACNQTMLCFGQSDKWLFHNSGFPGSCDELNLAIDENYTEKAIVSLYPNPVTGVSVLHMVGIQTAQVHIYSMTGALVKTYQVTNGADISIRKEDFANGLYSYRVSGASGEALQKGLFEVRN